MMFAEQATLPVYPLIQDAPPVSPVLLWIIAILLIILFIWLLLRERRARQEAAAREAEAMHVAEVETMAMPDPSTRLGGIEAPAVEPLAAPVVDDLEIIEGIGPKIASILKGAGVTSFAQLSVMEPAKITAILQGANLRLADPGSWPEQARLAAAGDMVGLKALQDQLKGGRQV